MRDVVAEAVNILILTLHTPPLRSRTTFSPPTKSCMDTRQVFPSPGTTPHFVCHTRLMLPFIQDFGVWNITYASVSCQEWRGWGDKAAKGSAPNINGCCPADPTVRSTTRWRLTFSPSFQGSQQDTCPSYSDGSHIPPDTTTSDAQSLWIPTLFSMIPFASSVVFTLLSYNLYA
jgi:hypothetical protein